MKIDFTRLISVHKASVLMNHSRFHKFGQKSFANAYRKSLLEICDGRTEGSFGQCFGFVNSFIISFLDFNEYSFYCGIQDAAKSFGFAIKKDDTYEKLIEDGCVLTMSWSKGGYGGFKYQFKKTESLNNKS